MAKQFTAEDLDEILLERLEPSDISAPPGRLGELTRQRDVSNETAKAVLGLGGRLTPRQSRIEQSRQIRTEQLKRATKETLGRVGVTTEEGGALDDLATNLAAGAVNTGARTLSALQSFAGSTNVAEQSARAGAEAHAGAEILDPSAIGKFTRGIGGLLADAPLILAGGGPAAIAGRVATALKASRTVGNLARVAAAVQPLAIREGLNVARERGAMEGLAAWGIETSIPAAFGGTGVEKLFTGSNQTLRGMGRRAANILFQGAAEATEEATTEFAQAIREYAFGNDRAFEGLGERLALAASLGGFAGGVVQAGSDAVRGRAVAAAKESGDALRMAVMARAALMEANATGPLADAADVEAVTEAPAETVETVETPLVPEAVQASAQAETPAPVETPDVVPEMDETADAVTSPPIVAATAGKISPLDVPPEGFTRDEVQRELGRVEDAVREAFPGTDIRRRVGGFEVRGEGGVKTAVIFQEPRIIARMAAASGKAGAVYDSVTGGGQTQLRDAQGRVVTKEAFVNKTPQARQKILERMDFSGWFLPNPRGGGVPIDADAAAFITSPSSVLHEGHHAQITLQATDAELSQAARYLQSLGASVDPNASPEALVSDSAFMEAFVNDFMQYRDDLAAGAEPQQRPGFLRRLWDRILAAFGVVSRAAEAGVVQHPLAALHESVISGEVAARPLQRLPRPSELPDTLTVEARREQRRQDQEAVRQRREQQTQQRLDLGDQRLEVQGEALDLRTRAQREQAALGDLRREGQLEGMTGQERARQEREALGDLRRDEQLERLEERSERRRGRVTKTDAKVQDATGIDRNERTQIQYELTQARYLQTTMAEGDPDRAAIDQRVAELRERLGIAPEGDGDFFSTEPRNLANPDLTAKGRTQAVLVQESMPINSMDRATMEALAAKLLRSKPPHQLIVEWEESILTGGNLGGPGTIALRDLLAEASMRSNDPDASALDRRIAAATAGRLMGLDIQAGTNAANEFHSRQDLLFTPRQRVVALHRALSQPDVLTRDRARRLFKRGNFQGGRKVLQDHAVKQRDTLLAKLRDKGIDPESWDPDTMTLEGFFEAKQAIDDLKTSKTQALGLVGLTLYNWMLSPLSVMRALTGNVVVGATFGVENFAGAMTNDLAKALTGKQIASGLGTTKSSLRGVASMLTRGMRPALANAAHAWVSARSRAMQRIGQEDGAARENVMDPIDALVTSGPARTFLRALFAPNTTLLGSVDQFSHTLAIQAMLTTTAHAQGAAEGL